MAIKAVIDLEDHLFRQKNKDREIEHCLASLRSSSKTNIPLQHTSFSLFLDTAMII